MANEITMQSLTSWIRECARVIIENNDALNELDSSMGDADHGSNLHRGFVAVTDALDREGPEDPLSLFKLVGMTLVSTVGGSSGALYGTLFLRMASTCKEIRHLDDKSLLNALRAGLEGVIERGNAKAGDKTMYDSLAPAVVAFEDEINKGNAINISLQAAANAADLGAKSTKAMLARKGRASYLGERSIGHVDPGATSIALLIGAAAATLA
jgi:dihydroxyacetone kinase-like protein